MGIYESSQLLHFRKGIARESEALIALTYHDC